MPTRFHRTFWTSAAAVAMTGSLWTFSAFGQAPVKVPAAKAPAARPALAPAAKTPATTEAAPPAASNIVSSEAAKLPLQPGGIDEAGLGQMIAALGLKPDKQLQRYDFAFRAEMEGTEWTLSMSAVLSQDQQSLWMMAWLDELPKSAEAVPRAALLRLLAENDTLGDGKMFAYIPNNRRFVMQRSVQNEQMTSAKFRTYLQDLGASVVETHGVWSSAQWVPGAAPAAGTAGTAPAASQASPSGAAAGQSPAARRPLNTAVNDSKTTTPVRK